MLTLNDRADGNTQEGALGVDPTVVDHDYVLGCFASFLCFDSRVKKQWVFKGGTCLAKCYFEPYRFSEDLDFTLLGAISPEIFREILDGAKLRMQDTVGIRADAEPTKIDVIKDEYGEESFEGRIYYRGPWNYGGSARSVRVHVNSDELVAFGVQAKHISHNYSDQESLPHVAVPSYSLEEVAVEKLRAFAGQRRNPVSRDIFDLFYLSKRKLDFDLVIGVFAKKCSSKRMSVKDLDIREVQERKEEYRANWEKHLEHLVPKELKIPFDVAWQKAIELISRTLRQ